MGADRIKRLACRLRRTGASENAFCFQKFIWVPLSDGTWELIAGATNQDHANIWREIGRPKLAASWGIGENNIPWAMEAYFIPSGYVDFREHRFREILMLQVPDPFPEGWDLSRLRRELFCGDQIRENEVKYDPQRSADPVIVKSYMKMFERIRSETAV